jgi:hypothetical protein
MASMSHTLSHSLIFSGLLSALCLGGVACKSSPEQPTAPDTQEPVATFTPDEDQNMVMPDGFDDKTVPGSDRPDIKTAPEFSKAQLTEIMTALGCPEPLIRGSECQVCPTIDPGVPMAPPLKTGPNTPFTLMPGAYVPGASQQLVASIDNCTDAQGNLDVTQVALLTRGADDQPWAITASTFIPHSNQCEAAQTAGADTRTVCRVQRNGKHGLVKAFHGISWAQLAVEQSGEQPKPMVTPLLEVTEGAGCAENWSVEQEVRYDLKDIDTDGVLDLVFEVTTEEGAYVSPLDECMDGTFEAPLKPVREVKTTQTTLIYHPTKQGFKESQERSYKLPLSDEYTKLMTK